MSPVRERFVSIIESLPYDLDEEIFKRQASEIVKEIVQRYIETYGIDDLSEEDKECAKSFMLDEGGLEYEE